MTNLKKSLKVQTKTNFNWLAVTWLRLDYIYINTGRKLNSLMFLTITVHAVNANQLEYFTLTINKHE